MTQDEAVAKLREYDDDDDPERVHSEADELVLEVLRTNGLSAVAVEFIRLRDRVGFWYA